MTRIAPDWLTWSSIQTVMKALAPAHPLFVGGCVRDALMGRVSEDIDIAVTTPPAETMALAQTAGLKAVATGIDHGVVTVIVGDRPYEVATLRRDVETDGRRAVVAFTERVEEDAARRDFTMNALYADGDGRVSDPLGEGLADLTAQRIRFIGEPQQRIREDYLRILRFFRFHAQFGISPVEAAGREACLADRCGLDKISAERVGAEMKKLLAAADPGRTLAAMGPILGDILPGAHWPYGLLAAEEDWRLTPDPIRRLAALGATSLDRLRLSKAETARISAINACMRLPTDEAAYRHGEGAACDALAILGKRRQDHLSRIRRAAEATFPVSAKDLMGRGLAPGPDLGAALRKLESEWIEGGFTPSREALLERL